MSEEVDGMEKVDNSPESVAFKEKLIDLFKSEHGLQSIEVCAILSQFAGQSAAHSIFLEGYSPQQALDTVAANSGSNFESMIEQYGGLEGLCPCADCQAEKAAKVN